jgi:hypothetical protein
MEWQLVKPSMPWLSGANCFENMGVTSALLFIQSQEGLAFVNILGII